MLFLITFFLFEFVGKVAVCIVSWPRSIYESTLNHSMLEKYLLFLNETKDWLNYKNSIAT